MVCLWILHIKTAVREMKIEAEFAKLTIERRLKDRLARNKVKYFPTDNLDEEIDLMLTSIEDPSKV